MKGMKHWNKRGAAVCAFLALLVSVCLLAGCAWVQLVWQPASPSPSPIVITGEGSALEVAILDVGQGDSILLVSPNGNTMLVDASTKEAYPQIREALQKRGIDKLDIVVATHPHADHIGGMKQLLEEFSVGVYYMTDDIATTKTFEALLDLLEEQQVRVRQAVADGETFLDWDMEATVQLLSPIGGVAYSDFNEGSVILRVTYGETSILLTGDAGKEAETMLLQTYPKGMLQSDVLKLGHHGSHTATSEAFLLAVAPQCAVASLGEGNSYGHPHTVVVQLLQEQQIPFYRTDEDGTVCIRLDGKEVTIQTEGPNE
jgi:competence protein ComEC